MESRYSERTRRLSKRTPTREWLQQPGNQRYEEYHLDEQARTSTYFISCKALVSSIYYLLSREYLMTLPTFFHDMVSLGEDDALCVRPINTARYAK